MFLKTLLGAVRTRRRASSGGRLRIAIVSTPRSGNTWLRHLLDHVYRFSDRHEGELALYNPLEAPWSRLPDRCIIMTHWHRVAPLPALFREHGFSVVTLARHPLDVLISILQYAPCGGSLRWLEGEGGGEESIDHAMPLSPEFRAYATGPRARALLSVSPQWWSHPDCHRVRYEGLVRNPRRELSRLCGRLGVEPSAGCNEAVEACSIERLRNPETARHFWQGKPGLWRRLLTPDVARHFAAAHREAFETLGYDCDPKGSTDLTTAAHYWSRLVATESVSHALASG